MDWNVNVMMPKVNQKNHFTFLLLLIHALDWGVWCKFCHWCAPVALTQGFIFDSRSAQWEYGHWFFKTGFFFMGFGVRRVFLHHDNLYCGAFTPGIQKHFTNTVGQFCTPLVVKTPTEINCRITSIESPPTVNLSENFICRTAAELKPRNCYLNYT